jgi:hypothetical protein
MGFFSFISDVDDAIIEGGTSVFGESAMDSLGLTNYAGEAAADATQAASDAQLAFQRESLDYLKEREAIPQQFREGAITSLGGLAGLEGGEGSQQTFIDQAKASPLYSAIMGGQQAGEESILRNQAMTGGFRSGSTQANLYDYNTNLSNQALLESYNQQVSGLQGLAGLPSNANQIASGITGLGTTTALGISGSSQALLAGQQQQGQNLMNTGMTALQLFSDIRLKENIQHVGKFNGHEWFEWDWNNEAKGLGLEGRSEGVMAHLVYEYKPEIISEDQGYIMVDYSQLGGH